MPLSPPKYPLDDVRDIKLRRLDEARRLVKQRREELKKEEEKLKKVEKERDEVKAHKQEKLDQLRDAFDEGTTTDEVIKMKRYLEVVEERLLAHEEKVKKQQEEVKKAEDALKMAEQEVIRKQVEVDKLDLHKEQWLATAWEEFRKEEEKEFDEVGNVLYLKNRDKWK